MQVLGKLALTGLELIQTNKEPEVDRTTMSASMPGASAPLQADRPASSADAVDSHCTSRSTGRPRARAPSQVAGRMYCSPARPKKKLRSEHAG